MARLKVRCIDNRAFLHEEEGSLVRESRTDELISLTKGRVYEVIAIEHGWYRILDDTADDYLYPPELFEIVE